jgi:hypothetical protein
MFKIAPALLLLLCWPAAAARAQTPKEDRVDRAVASALAFLQTVQETDGAWTAGGSKSPAVTGLAVLAYLSAGHVPGEGPYGRTVEKGVRWVLQSQRDNGAFAAAFGQEMYHQGICTLALTQVAGMADGELAREIKGKLEKAVALILRAQRTTGAGRGGWRYTVQGFDADMSVTGWQMLALRAAKNLGCDVPAERIDLAVDYVLRCREPRSGGFCYMAGGAMTIPCTGTGVLCLEICGKGRHRTPEALQAGAVLLKQPPQGLQPHLAYSLYYGSQAMFQLGNNYWLSYRPQLHKILLDNQQANGSWLTPLDFQGPSYTTAMAVLALTVEYRYLPIYQRGEDSPEEK